MITQELQKIGFSPKEASVYLAMLELGLASVQDIAQKAGVNRATTYVMIDILTKKGLVHTVTRGKKRYFAIEEPKHLLHVLEEKKDVIQKNLDMINAIMPDLESRYNLSGTKPIVRFFEGKEGLKSIQEDILKTKSPLFYECVPLDESTRVFPPLPGDYREKIQAKTAGSTRKTIYSSVKTPITEMPRGSAEFRCVPAGTFPFTSEIVVYGENKIAIISYRDNLSGVLIESRDMHQTFKTMFDLMWAATDKYHTECYLPHTK